MKKSCYTDSQIMSILKQAENGTYDSETQRSSSAGHRNEIQVRAVKLLHVSDEEDVSYLTSFHERVLCLA
ncbi:hypothetical protein [Halodesulfovibrio aestuarii]|uniref:Transposase n=1 Tax=Halodesulfovibrio aestuarii TaxID=126333 RepID=A0ABV4JSW8_9BACT